MKILVTVKRVIDYNVKVHIREDRTDVDLANTKMAINPFCEIAVEEAILLKEQGVADEVVVVSVGPSESNEQLRTALAMGADRGLLVQDDRPLAPLAVAKLLRAVYEREKPSLILMGKQSIDGDNQQTGQMLAALASLPQGTCASQIKFVDDTVHVTREVDGGLETVALRLPAVVTADLRLNTPRYTTLPKIMQARRKPIEVLTAAELGVETESTVTLLKVEPPPKRTAGIKVNSVDELVDKLRNEAKVI